MTAKIDFYGSAQPLHKQLDVPKEVLRIEEQLRDSMDYLYLYDALTEDERKKVIKRLGKRVEITVMEYKKQKSKG